MASPKMLLDLPTKMLEQITKHVTEEALFPLRLTCMRLHDVSFKIFAAEYLARLMCCFMDGARLRRVLDIVSIPKLCGQVDEICFTVDVIEDQYDKIQFVRPRDQGVCNPDARCRGVFKTKQTTTLLTPFLNDHARSWFASDPVEDSFMETTTSTGTTQTCTISR